ncbi:protein FAR1-RELATED SEQUENCE 5-like [Spinacia oleracea]|uniref:Protein FAR1-RELATED SEQUENCE 5-like n=1 Tax=Spinacia oleracea TaxID=3562 RepID=A0A9R0I9M9_SPIOL|nr:protein FAR1-RELATED SEQUENCE 5-like [Spinacia oleracea]
MNSCRTGLWIMRRFVCSNASFKDVKKETLRKYERFELRTGCTAFIQFSITKDGVWTVVRHNMTQNHHMIPADKRYLLRSQRDITEEQLKYLSAMKASGCRVPDLLRAMRKEVGGSPNLGFITADAYNALAAEKAMKLDGKDYNQLNRYFAQRQSSEKDFYYNFELDEHGYLISLF